MTTIEIHCPNCDSPSITKDGADYHCNKCGRYFQVISSSKRKEATTPSRETIKLSIKYGKAALTLQNAEKLGNFILDKPVNIKYVPVCLFRFKASKYLKRGDTIVNGNVAGYVFLDPLSGRIDHVQYNKNGVYPDPHEFGNKLLGECIRIVISQSYEDKPLERHLEIPNMVPAEKMQQDVLAWLTNDFRVQVTYTIRSAKGYDSGFRSATFSYKKKDFESIDLLGVFAVPTLHLMYKHPNSKLQYKRDIYGYSGEMIQSDLNCSKSTLMGHPCGQFPENVCVGCGNLLCNDHTKICENCKATVCKDCTVTKGLISKHNYCPSCGRALNSK